MKVLVIGVNGFTGWHLVQQLFERKCYQIYGADIHPLTDIKDHLAGYFHLDVLDLTGLIRIITDIRPAIIYNLAGILKAEDDRSIYAINFLGTVNVLEAVKKIDHVNIKMLFVGSSAEYGNTVTSKMPITEEDVCNPIVPYAISKYAATMAIQSYVEKFKLKAVVVRPFNIIGKGMPDTLLVGALLNRIKKLDKGVSNMTIEVGNIHTYRDFIDIEDVTNAYINIMSGEYWGKVFNICSGKPTQIKAVLELLLSFSSKKIDYFINPDLVRKDDVITVYGSCEKANQAFGFSPLKPIEVSLKEAWVYEFKNSHQ